MDISADEFIDKMIGQGIVVVGADFASRSDEAVMMTVKCVDGEPVCQIITHEEFYAATNVIEAQPVPDTVVAMQKLMEQAQRDFNDVTGIGKIMLQPKRQGKSVYAAMQKMLIDRFAAEPQIYIPPIERTHPTSPRKRLK